MVSTAVLITPATVSFLRDEVEERMQEFSSEDEALDRGDRSFGGSYEHLTALCRTDPAAVVEAAETLLDPLSSKSGIQDAFTAWRVLDETLARARRLVHPQNECLDEWQKKRAQRISDMWEAFRKHASGEPKQALERGPFQCFLKEPNKPELDDGAEENFRGAMQYLHNQILLWTTRRVGLLIDERYISLGDQVSTNRGIVLASQELTPPSW